MPPPAAADARTARFLAKIEGEQRSRIAYSNDTRNQPCGAKVEGGHSETLRFASPRARRLAIAVRGRDMTFSRDLETRGSVTRRSWNAVEPGPIPCGDGEPREQPEPDCGTRRLELFAIGLDSPQRNLIQVGEGVPAALDPFRSCKRQGVMFPELWRDGSWGWLRAKDLFDRRRRKIVVRGGKSTAGMSLRWKLTLKRR